MSAPDPFETIASLPPALDAGEAMAIARDEYGIDATARPLVSERDQNFLLETDEGRRFILKVANVAEDPAVTRCQVAALLHIEAAAGAGLAVPRIVRSRKGASDIAISSPQGRHVARVVTWLPGALMEQQVPTPAMAHRLGRFLGELDRALEGFRHPGENQVLLWDMKRAAELRPLIGHVADEAARQCLSATLDEFESIALPAFRDLSWQVIHNDANPANVLVAGAGDSAVAGLIDFGDMLHAPRIVELAVAASYLRVLDGDPLALTCELVGGYHARRPVETAETDLLHILIKTRLAASTIILAWRASLRGEDDEYLAAAGRSEVSALPFLEQLAGISDASAAQRYREACAAPARA
jgi:hydroxylysine kinase